MSQNDHSYEPGVEGMPVLQCWKTVGQALDVDTRHSTSTPAPEGSTAPSPRPNEIFVKCECTILVAAA